MRKRPTTAGFTFTEMIVVVAIFGLAVIAIMSAVTYFYRANAYNVEQAFAVNNARKAIEFMVRDIREATYGDTGAYPLIAADVNSLYFYSDVDRDNNVERVRYFLDGTDLKKGVTNSSGDPLEYDDADEIVTVIAEHVQNGDQGVQIFHYFDSSGGELLNLDANLTNIAFVTVDVIVNINPTRLPNEFTLHSSATIRNLKVNL